MIVYAVCVISTEYKRSISKIVDICDDEEVAEKRRSLIIQEFQEGWGDDWESYTGCSVEIIERELVSK